MFEFLAGLVPKIFAKTKRGKMRRVKKIEIDVESGVMEIDTTKIDISKYGAVNIQVDLLFECVDVLKYGKAPSKPKKRKKSQKFFGCAD